ncbi:MAG: transporter substrate-binding domain-containing protein [Magnetospirillum sp. WYHS-4]
MLPVLALAGFFWGAPLAAGTLPEIEYAYPDQSVWTTKVTPQGEPDNPLLRLAESLFAQAGIPWRGRAYPAARMFNALQDGTAQFSLLVKAPRLQECCLLSRAPVVGTELRAYRRASVPPIATEADLAGKRIIVIRGYSYAGLRDFIADSRNGVESHAAGTHEEAFAMLERGRADYLLDYAGPATEVLAAHPVGDLRYTVLSRLDVHLVLVKTYPDAQKVLDRLEAIAAALDKREIIGLSPRP